MAYKYPTLEGESHHNRSLSDDLPLFVFIPNDSYLEKVSMTWSDFDHKIKE